jgi:hypothetical protein
MGTVTRTRPYALPLRLSQQERDMLEALRDYRARAAGVPLSDLPASALLRALIREAVARELAGY